MDYKLLRRKRKSLSIVVKDGKVTVIAPKRLSLDFIQSFVSDKQAWIDKKLEQFQSANNRFEDVLSYKAILLFGKMYKIVTDEKIKRIKLLEDRLLCPSDLFRQRHSNKQNANRFVHYLKLLIKRIAKKELNERLHNFAMELGFDFIGFGLSDARTKWGSCDSNKKILLNFRLVMLEEDLINYVIIHELCHTRICNHSVLFWEEVRKYIPNYKDLRKRLKENSILTQTLRLK